MISYYIYLSVLLSVLISTCVYVVADGIISFLYTPELYSTVPMNHIFFIHSSVTGRLDCFHV